MFLLALLPQSHSVPRFLAVSTLPLTNKYADKADFSADLVLTSLGSDEAVEEVYSKLFKGQEVGLMIRHRTSTDIRPKETRVTVLSRAVKGAPRSSSTLVL